MAIAARTIFVADDDESFLSGVGRALRGRGYAVRTAPDGLRLLSLMEIERPDLLVLDVAMPGMNGVEVLRTIRRDGRWPLLPVMMVTAAPDAEVHAAVVEASAELLPKPFRLEELLARVAGSLGAPGLAGPDGAGQPNGRRPPH